MGKIGQKVPSLSSKIARLRKPPIEKTFSLNLLWKIKYAIFLLPFDPRMLYGDRICPK
jgi:hypothetical protein